MLRLIDVCTTRRIKELKGLMTFSKLVHPNIMKVYGVYDEKCPTGVGFGKPGQHIPYIILEHCPCTDLFSFLESRHSPPPPPHRDTTCC